MFVVLVNIWVKLLIRYTLCPPYCISIIPWLKNIKGQWFSLGDFAEEHHLEYSHLANWVPIWWPALCWLTHAAGRGWIDTWSTGLALSVSTVLLCWRHKDSERLLEKSCHFCYITCKFLQNTWCIVIHCDDNCTLILIPHLCLPIHLNKQENSSRKNYKAPFKPHSEGVGHNHQEEVTVPLFSGWWPVSMLCFPYAL